MNALTRAELLKLRSTRMLAWLLLATLAMVALTVAFSVPSATATNNALSLDEPALLARIVGVSFGVPQVTMVAPRCARVHPGGPLRHHHVDVPRRAAPVPGPRRQGRVAASSPASSSPRRHSSSRPSSASR